MDNHNTNEVVASPTTEVQSETHTQDQGNGMVYNDSTYNPAKEERRRHSSGFYKLVQRLAGSGEITESERRRRRAAGKRSRVSRKYNQKLARLKKGKAR